MNQENNSSTFINNYLPILDYFNQEQLSEPRRRFWRDAKVCEARKNSILREVLNAHSTPLTLIDWQEAYVRAVELAAFATDNFVVTEGRLKREETEHNRIKRDYEDLANHNEQLLRVSEDMYIRQQRKEAEDEWSNEVADSINETMQATIERLQGEVDRLTKENEELKEKPSLGERLAWCRRAGRLVAAPATQKEREEHEQLLGKQQIENSLLRDKVKELTHRTALLTSKIKGEDLREPEEVQIYPGKAIIVGRLEKTHFPDEEGDFGDLSGPN